VRTEKTEVTREAAYEQLCKLRAEFAGKEASLHEFNEAKTRLLVIDRILECVGWNRSQFNPEAASGSAGYTDYLLSLENEPRLVIEAKRAGQTFSANKHLAKNFYQLTYVRSAFGQALTEVLDQAERYARQHHVPFAVLSNGKEWVAVQLIPSPGQSAENLKCVYFGNLLAEDSNFDLFWSLLSMPAIRENALAEQFADLNAQEAEFSATPRAAIGHLTWKAACAAETRVEDFYRLFFDEIVDPARRLMLEHCFVSSSKLDQYEGSLKRVLKDAAPKYIEGATDLSPGDREALLRGNLGDKAGRVVLVTGSVGCGKSTFIHKVLVESRQDQKIQAVLVDLIDDYDPSDPTTLLWRRVHEAWRHDVPESLEYGELKKTFRVQLKELKKGPHAQIFEADASAYSTAEAQRLHELSSDNESFLAACWRHYATNHGIGVVLFLDNVDRTSKAFQRNVYNFAHRLARLTGATVIVPMREATYFRGKESDFLDVRTNDFVFHLQAPDPLQVIARRIRYVETHAEDDFRHAHFKNDMGLFRAHAAALKERVLGQTQDRNIVPILSALAWHDIRSFLALLRQVHVALGTEAQWSTENLLAALMTAESPVGSIRIPNLYKPPYPTYPSLYVRTRILAALLYAPRADQVRHGVSLDILLRFLRGAGYHERWARRALEELVQERLLECLEAPAAAEYSKEYRIETHHSYRPSPLAVLLMERLQKEPIYLALIGADMTYHSEKAYDAYVKAMRDFLSAIDTKEFEPTAVALLSESAAPQIVGTYLAKAFRHEQPLAEITKYQADAFAIESKLRNTLELLPGFSMEKKPQSRPPPPLVESQQLNLALQNEKKAASPRDAIPSPCPAYVRETAISGSTLAPAIFWSLVVLNVQGQKWASGAEITRAINQHVFSDQERKEPTNVSRALRRPVLREQPWLVAVGEEGNYRYALSESWQEHWHAAFGCAPPEISA